ncbi:lipoprotein, putative [Citrifermentans bemidjiense Bem]|uniref:Lipoprotein, putative n=1 Tax=Citrifermentans bemidjiense (strain ATCC BAA-1014 / DSM 16622 / JCM 12645 / Bem) TaxID=404380 RepID=B5EHS9_CITBB|nr:hypothetical protein [Citrifermentans bemidjiense]ACH39728.1 lipoprotein, putative [Citrifermentans bemidjiense Bem]
MNYRVLRRGLQGILTLGVFLAAGCGGGGGGVTSGNSVHGVVADGYLENARVFLDLNDDKQFTTGEPTAMTAVDGSYTITGVTAAQLAAHALVVRAEASVTKNHEGGSATTLTDSYVLSTPPNAPKTADGQVVITPLTTLIHNQIETNPVLNVAAAEAVVKTNLGVADATSLFDDFVQKKGASLEYERVSMVAQVVASAIGSNMTAISTAAPTANLNDVIKMVVSEVVAQLNTISSEVDTAKASGSFNPTALATTAVTIDTSNAGALQASIAQAATAPVVGSFQTALGTDGFFYLDRQYDLGTVTYEYGKVKLGAQGTDGYALTEEFFRYDTLNSSWAAATDTTNNYVLSKTGWVPEDDNASSGKLVFNADGTATWTNIQTGDSEIITVSKMDVAGKGIASFLTRQSSPINPAATFPAGSEAYKMTFTRKSDHYSVWLGGYPNSMLMNVAKVSDIPARFPAAGDQLYGGLYIGSYLSVRFSGSGTSGTLQFFGQGAPLSLEGTWKIVEPVAGYPVLVLDVPLSYRTQYMDYSPEKIIFAQVNGSIRQGEAEYANVPRMETGYNFNKTAFDAIMSNFNPSLGTTLKKAVKTTVKKTARKSY